MMSGFDKRWLLPIGVLIASALVASSVIVFKPSLASRSSAEVVAPQAASEPVVDCSGTSASDYACHQERYQNLVRDSGVEAAFDELKDEHKKNGFVKSACHQLTHAIGLVAADLYGNVAGAYAKGDHFCGAGYYHGVTEAVVTKIGAGKMLDQADTLCIDLRENQRYSLYLLDCAHGLGHGFMKVLENELFEALEGCDALTDTRERDNCYGGVFMQNAMAKDDPTHPSKYLKVDQPLYPCTDVDARYKNMCYKNQIAHALRTQDNDFTKVFDLCATVAEDDFRPACYWGVGGQAFAQSMEQNITDMAQARYTNMLCTVGEDYEAWSNCVIGAVRTFIYHNLYHNRSDTRINAFCESFNADLGPVCLKTAEGFYEELFKPD